MKVRLILDSGAYSAWKRGESINLDNYIEYIKRNKDYVDKYINLDVIPGRPGFTPTKEEVDLSAKQSYINLQIMKDAGLDPIPVFHQGERFYWLDQLLEDGEKYIGVSPAEDMIGWRGPPPHIWLDKVFDLLTDKQGYPIVDTHGFGVGKHSLLIRYPWTTCDSTSWTQYPNYGKILVPVCKDRVPLYLKQPLIVHMSDVTKRTGNKFGSARQSQKDQYGNLSLVEQQFVRRFVEEDVGTTMTEVRYDDSARRICVIKFFQNLCIALGDNVRFQRQGRFF